MTAALLLIGGFAAVPGSASGQTTGILPSTATLNPRGDAAARGAIPGGQPPSQLHGIERIRRGEGRPPHGRTCFTQVEAREAIAARRLIDPVRALRLGRQQGDALSAKLCRWTPDEFVYEVAVLRHDGRILHLFMNAQNGEAVSGQSQTGQATGPATGLGTGQAGARAPDGDR